MRSRWLAVAVLGAIALGTTVLGATGAALRTAAGRAVVVRALLDLARRALDGHVTVGAVGGSLTGGLDAREVQVWDLEGTLLARFARLQARYRLSDLLNGRAVLGQVILTAPSVNLTQGSDGVFNYERAQAQPAGRRGAEAAHRVPRRGDSGWARRDSAAGGSRG